MSDRLAGGLIDYIESSVSSGTSGRAWIVIEGVRVDLAEAIASKWPDALPDLYVAGPEDHDFNGHALGDRSATQLRNEGGMCLILCEGHRIPDSQSVRAFDRYSPEDLVRRKTGLELLAAQLPEVGMGDGIAAVFEAVLDPKLERPPSPQAVARFLDAVATGRSTGESLNELGGFRDPDSSELTRQRVLVNLNLAALRGSPDRLRPSSLSEIRVRAQRVLNPPETPSSDEVVEMLLRQDDSVLERLSFELATAVLEEPASAELPDEVKRDLEHYAAENADSKAEVEQLKPTADLLGDAFEARHAAQSLLTYDGERQQAVLRASTRRRLRSLRREKSVSSDSIEEALLNAIDHLPSEVKSIQLKEPELLNVVSSEAQARSVLALAAAHVRIAPLLKYLEGRGVVVPGALLSDPLSRLRGAVALIGQPARSTPRRVVMVARGDARGDVVEFGWTPSPEDLALLASGLGFAGDEPTLTLETDSESRGAAFTTRAVRGRQAPEGSRELAEKLRNAARTVLRSGYTPRTLRGWTETWSDAVKEAEKARRRDLAELDALAYAGGVVSPGGEVTLTHMSPLKAEWLAARTEAWLELLGQSLGGSGTEATREAGDPLPAPVTRTARAIADATAAQYPGFVISSGSERPLLAGADGAVLSAFGVGRMAEEVVRPSLGALEEVVRKLVHLHPEASQYLRCAAWQESAADLMMRALLRLMQRSDVVTRAEVVCIDGRPEVETLQMVDEWARGENRGRIALRFVDSLQDWVRAGASGPDFHLAAVEGITKDPARVRVNIEEVPEPEGDEDVLFMPKTWVRPERTNLLLSPPRLSRTGRAWHRLMTALDDSWPDGDGATLRTPEIRTDISSAREGLSKLHELAHWVVTLDRFANRESLTAAVGSDVAILHQERRPAGSAAEGLVISQRSGGTADRAIERSLKRAGLLDETAEPDLAQKLRRAAAQGYGILALRAATTGSGINELIGHVAGFHRLTTTATPWPLPPGCRVVLLSLDEYADWFGRTRRADLLALALSPDEGGIHAANVEVKAVRHASAVQGSLAEAKEQLRRTLIDSRFAAYPNGSLYSRLWLNRIAEAAIAVCRENGLRLSSEDLEALDRFRRGDGVLEWAGVGMVFAPGAEERVQHSQIPLMRDRVPVVLASVALTQGLLRDASTSDGTKLRTVATGRPTLAPSTKSRRFAGLEEKQQAEEEPAAEEQPTPDSQAAGTEEAAGEGGKAEDRIEEERQEGAEAGEAPVAEEAELVHPILGWDAISQEAVEWRVTGPGALSNGHVEVYGTSGAGKTQFIMSLLTQLQGMGSHFGVCDFKNDYGADFPEAANARFYDLWNEPLPYNPLSIDNPSRRALQGLIIELRDTVEIAARPYARLGHRQLGKLQEAFEESFEDARRRNGAPPTLAGVHGLLDEDLRGVIGDLTGTDLFGEGPPLGELIDADVIFGLNHIPGTGLTTTLAAGFILSALYLKLLELPQVANKVTYSIVIDEAHRVANFHSVANMVRELRSKGLAVILATQRPGDLPEEATTNAQTKVFLRLPDAQSAKAAARALDPADRNLASEIRSLSDGEAYVGVAGGPPQLIKLRQFWRDG